jgi:hypothetical protein
MPEGMVCVLKVVRSESLSKAIEDFNALLTNTDFPKILQPIPESGLNHLIFRCDAEEYDITKGERGPYGLGEYG